MTELAAHLVDRVIPDVPVRQWVLSLPWSLRYQLAFDAGLCRDVLAVFIRVVFDWLRRRAASEGLRDGQCGAVTVIQRFGRSLNVNVHIHSLVLNGVFTRSEPAVAPVFHALTAPTGAEVAEVLDQVCRRVLRLLRRGSRLPEEESSPSDPVAEQMPLLAEYASASIQGLVASGPRAGQPVRRLRSAAAVVDGAKPRCARLEGFSLHANVGVPAHARGRLEHLCRYLLRPPLALERLTESSHGQLLFELPHPRTDGATPLLLDPLERIEKVAILIPPPRFHTLRFHGLLAPHAGWRSLIVPRPAEGAGQAGRCPAAGEPALPGNGSARPAPEPGRLSWTALLRRVFALDVFHCPRCGGRRRIVGVHPGGESVRGWLERLGLDRTSPSAAPSRSPPRRGA